jgi:hypothetical protein
MFFRWLDQEEWDKRGMRHIWETGEVHTGFWCGNLGERGHLVDPGMDGSAILKWIYKKWEGGAWPGVIWLRIGTPWSI